MNFLICHLRGHGDLGKIGLNFYRILEKKQDVIAWIKVAKSFNKRDLQVLMPEIPKCVFSLAAII
jgi:hypothetical protein